MTNEKGDPPQAGKAAAEDAPKPARRSKGMSQAWTLLGILFLIGVVLQHALGGHAIHGEGGQRTTFVLVGLAAFLVTLGAGFRPAWHRFLSSNRFSVPAILALAVISVLGTLILQSQPQDALDRAYGSFAKLLQALFLDDVFHSLGFVIVLGTSAGGLALTIARRRKLTLRYSGALAAHLGLLLILAGAAVGNVWVTKGRLNMHVGQSADEFFVRASAGGMLAYPLGFQVRLDDFQLDMYEPEYRLMLFALEGNEEQRLASVDPADEKDRAKLAEHGVTVEKYWPDHVSELLVEPTGAEAPSAEAPAALGLAPGSDEGAQPIWLFDRGEKTGGQKTVNGQRLAFFWDEARAAAFAQTQAEAPKAAPHALIVAGQELAVEAGQPVPLPGSKNTIEITRAFGDFVIDAETKEPANRSDQPNNPAVEVVVTDPAGKELARKFLFAKFPGFAHQGENDPLAGVTYRFAGGSAGGQRVSWIVVGQSGQWWKMNAATVEDRSTVAPGKATPLPGGVDLLAIHAAAKTRQVDKTLSNKPNNPVAAVKLARGGATRQVSPQRPLRIGKNEALVLAPKGGESVRDYISTLSVVVDGKKVKTEKVEVNYPLEFEGYRFYQSDYRPDDPTFSGFQVVRDSGLWLVYLGFIVNMLGVLLAVALPAILKRRNRLSAAKGGA